MDLLKSALANVQRTAQNFFQPPQQQVNHNPMSTITQNVANFGSRALHDVGQGISNEFHALPQQVSHLGQDFMKVAGSQPLFNLPNPLGFNSPVQVNNKPLFGPTTGQYFQGQFAKPFQTVTNPNASPMERIGSGVQLGFNLMPSTHLLNLGVGGVAGGLKTLREGGDLNQNVSNAIANPSDIAGTGLGVKNPVLALGIDALLTRNPKNIVEDPLLINAGKAALGKVFPGMAQGMKGVSPRAFNIHPDDQALLTNVIGRFQAKEKLFPEDLKDIQTLAEHYLGEKFRTASTKKIIDAFDYVLAAQNGGIKGKFPKMGFAGENQVSTKAKNMIQGLPDTTLPTQADRSQPNLLNEMPSSSLEDISKSSSIPSTQKPKSLEPQNLSGIEQGTNFQGSSQTQPYDEIIAQGKKEIGSFANEPKKTFKQVANDFYTNWVDRFNPLVQAAGKAEKAAKGMGAELRPEVNPRFTIRRFLGMGGMAEDNFNQNIKPVLDQLDQMKVDKSDFDLYLKSRREVGFGQVGRDIYGSDPAVAQQRLDALNQKYGDTLAPLADKLYQTQDKSFSELAQSGFFTPEDLQAIKTQNPDYVPFQRVMDKIDEFIGMPTKTVQQATNPIKGIKGSDKQIYSPLESIIMNNFKLKAAVEKNNVANSLVGLQKVVDLGFQKVAQSAEDTVTVWQNGQKNYYKVGKDIADAVKGMNEESMNTFLKVLTIPAKILRQGATGQNPDFMLPNVIRDQFDAAINSKYGYVPVVDYIRGLGHLIKEDFGGGDQLYRDWMQSGGSQSFSELSGRKAVSTMINQTQAKRRIWNWASDALNTMGRYSEVPTRLGIYGKALEKTGNKMISAYESREGTMDFSRMGAKMKVANSIIPFLNVGVQGFDKIIRTAKENPKQLALRMGMFAVTPQLMSSLYNNVYHPQEYAKIPQYVRDSNFVFVNGTNQDGSVNYVAIPKGNVLPYVTNPIESFVSYLAHTNQQSFQQFAMQFLSSSLPVIGDGQSLKEIATKTIGNNLPQTIKPATENLMNKSFFKYDSNNQQSKEIVPYYTQKKPPAEQAYTFTPVAYKKIGALLNVSPLMVQNAMEGYFAGYTKIPVNIIQSLSDVANNNPVDSNQIPILRRFMQHTYAPTNGAPAPVDNKQRVGLFQNASASTDNNQRVPLLNQASASTAKDQATLLKQQVQDKALKAQVKQSGKAAFSSTGDLIYTNSKGNASTLSLTPPTQGTGIGAFANSNWAATKAASIWNNPDIPQDVKNQALQKLKIDPQDARYAALAAHSTDVSTQYIISKSPDHQTLIKNLVSGRVVSNTGQQFASDAVISSLKDQGLLSDAEAKALKKIKADKQGNISLIKTPTGKKAKKPTFVPRRHIAAPKMPKTAIKLTQAPKMPISNIKFNVPDLGVPQGLVHVPNFKAKIHFNV